MPSLFWKCLIVLLAFTPFTSALSAPLATKPVVKTQPTLYQAAPSMVTEKAIINKNPPAPVEVEAEIPDINIDRTKVQKSAPQPDQIMELYVEDNVHTFTMYQDEARQTYYDNAVVSFLDENFNVVATENVSYLRCLKEAGTGLEKWIPVWQIAVHPSARETTDTSELKYIYSPYASFRTPDYPTNLQGFVHPFYRANITGRKKSILDEDILVRLDCNPATAPSAELE